MTKRVPLQTIVVSRPKGFPDHAKDEKEVANYVPEIGKPFDFTADEIKQLDKMNPAALGTKAEVDVTEVARNNDGSGGTPSEMDRQAPANAVTPQTANDGKPAAAPAPTPAAAKTTSTAKRGSSDDL